MSGYSGTWSRLSQQVKREYRDNGIDCYCYICGGLIQLDLHHNDPMAFTLDHLLERRLGGSDDLANAAPAHRSCNAWRSAHNNGIANGELPKSRRRNQMQGRVIVDNEGEGSYFVNPLTSFRNTRHW